MKKDIIVLESFTNTKPICIEGKGPLHPPILVTIGKKTHQILTFSNILGFLVIFSFFTTFSIHTASPLPLHITRYVAFWPSTAMPAATTILILDSCILALIKYKKNYKKRG